MDRARLLKLIGNARGSYDQTAGNIQGGAAPRVYGRCWVSPVPLLSMAKTGGYPDDSGTPYADWSTFATKAPLGAPFNTLGATFRPSDCVDAIYALGQAGLTVRGIRVQGKYLGVRKNSAGAWTGDEAEALTGLSQAFSAFCTHVPSPGHTDYEWAPIELVNGEVIRRSQVAAASDGTYRAHPAWVTEGYHDWTHLVGTDAEGLSYRQLTTLRCIGVPRQAGQLPSGVEVLVDGIGGVTCSPVVAIRDILEVLMKVPSARIITATGPDGLAASSYERWCQVMAVTFVVASVVDGDPVELLAQLLEATGAELVPTGDGSLRVQPLGDMPVSTYTPASTGYVVDDIAADVVTVRETPLGETFNAVTVTYTDPARPDKEQRVTFREEEDIRRTGLREGDTISSKWITTAVHARWVGALAVRRSLRCRTKVTLTLDPRYILLEQGDVIEVRDAVMAPALYRITQRDLDVREWKLELEAERWSGQVLPLEDLTPDPPQGFAESGPTALDLAAPLAAEQAQATATAAQGTASSAQTTADQAIDDAADALAAAGTAQTTANGRNRSYYQATQPSSGMVAGDLWFDTDDHYKPYRYSGSAWQLVHDSTPVVAAEIDAGAVTADKLSVTELSAISANLGTVTAGTVNADTVNIGGLSAAKQYTMLMLSDMSRALGSLLVAGYLFALDEFGASWVTYSENAGNGRYLLNGNTEAYVNTFEPTPYGDVVWDSARGCFQACSNGSPGLQQILVTASGTTGINRRSSTGALTIGFNPSSSDLVAGPDGSTSNLYFSSNGTSWSTLSGVFPTGYVQCVCSLGADGWLVVGQNASGNVVGAWSADGSSWSAISLPSNTGGTVTSGRTSTSAVAQGVVAGTVGGTVIIMTQSYLWYATLGATLSSSANWARIGNPTAVGAPPMRARATSSVLAVTFAGLGLVAVTADGIHWRWVFPAGMPGVASAAQRVLGLSASQQNRRGQLACLMGSAAGSPARAVASGQVNEWYD